MLDSSITLPVVGGDVVVQRFSEEKDKSTYRFAGATWANRKEVSFLRSVPKPNGNYPGNARGTVKLTWDTEVTDRLGATIVAPIIVTIQASVPVGVNPSVFADIMANAAAALNHADLPEDVFYDLQI